MRNHYLWLLFVTVLTLFSLWIALPADLVPFTVDLDEDGAADFDEFSQGLDLVGGLRVLLQAELPPEAYTTDDLRETANSVSRRVNALGLAEATIQLQGSSRILVELPGVTDPEQAIETIQQTALLEFVDFAGLSPGQVNDLIGQRVLTSQQVLIDEQRAANAANQEQDANEEADASIPEVPRIPNPINGQPFETVMTGDALEAARAEFQQTQWVINFSLTGDGADIFGPFTAQRIGQPLAIVLDGVVLSAPTIQDQLTTGGVISGSFTEDEAKQLALQLRSGSLAIPLRVETAETVGATLGQESVELSIRAGIVGVIIVLSFMFVYYRVPGLAADFALIVFILLNLAAFKLIPVTLTLPAIAGFLISIGTAVDGNILIFERLKEELRNGQKLEDALDAGFDRAWTSIRDSNISTIIICGILFLFGQTPGASIVSGFAITLAIGLILNLFTAVLVTRTFLYIIINSTQQPIMNNRRLLLGI